jgi:hypothetical protein
MDENNELTQPKKVRYQSLAYLLTYNVLFEEAKYKEWFHRVVGAYTALHFFRDEVDETTRVLVRLQDKPSITTDKRFLPVKDASVSVTVAPIAVDKWTRTLDGLVANETSEVEEKKQEKYVIVSSTQPSLAKATPGQMRVPNFMWQREFMEELQDVPTQRTVIWYCDGGNGGKTYLARYLSSSNPKKYLWIDHPRDVYNVGATMKRAVKNGWTGYCVIFDVERKINRDKLYVNMEWAKNGSFLCSRGENPLIHVVVFANFFPDPKALSPDRWDVRKISVDCGTAVRVPLIWDRTESKLKFDESLVQLDGFSSTKLDENGDEVRRQPQQASLPPFMMRGKT